MTEFNREKKPLGYILRKFPVLSETFILNEILELETQGNEVHIFSVEKPNDPRFHKELYKLRAEVTYLPDPIKSSSLWKHFKRARKNFPKGYWEAIRYSLSHANPTLWLRFLQSCVVANHAKKLGIKHFHAHFATRATSVAFLSSMISGLPYSFTAHAVDIFKESLSKKALQRKIDDSAFVVTVSDFNKKHLSGLSRLNSDKIIKVHNGIDLDLFQPGIIEKNETFTFLCVARFVEKKGHHTLIEACRLLKEQNIPFNCLLIGRGPLQSQIEKAIKEKGLSETVKVLGSQTQDKVLERYHGSHAYVLLCKTAADGNKDGLPVAIVEALACGIPVITTPMTGNPEVVKHMENGFLVPFDNPERTAEAMKMMIMDNYLYKSLSERARPSVMETFDLRKTVGLLAKEFHR